MANRISHEQRKLIIRLLCEGNSLRSVSRVTGCHGKTVARVILDFGNSCRIFLDDQLRGLTLDHLECDEIWSFVGKKQARLTIDERAERHDIGDVYLWTAVDKTTKLIPAFLVGKRSGDNARRFMVDLASRLVFPKPHAGDAHAFQSEKHIYVTQVSTDAFPGYREAVDLAFGGKARYGQIIKEYKNAVMNYAPSEMVGTKRTAIRGITAR